MRLRTLLTTLSLIAVGGCVVKEYDGPAPQTGNQPSTTVSGNGAPATPATPATPTTTATPATPTGVVATPTGPTSGIVANNTPNLVGNNVTMNKPNAFGKPSPFEGAIKGTVFPLAEGTNKLPDNFSKMAPIAQLFSQSWDISPRDFKEGFPGVPNDRVEWFAIEWDGTIHVKTAGVYHFKMNSDDGARLMIDNILVVNDDGLHAAKIAEGDTTLNAGDHHLIIDYFQGPKYQLALQIWVSGTNMPQRIMTSSF